MVCWPLNPPKWFLSMTRRSGENKSYFLLFFGSLFCELQLAKQRCRIQKRKSITQVWSALPVARLCVLEPAILSPIVSSFFLCCSSLKFRKWYPARLWWEALLCAQRTQVQTYFEACSSLLETLLKSPCSWLSSEFSGRYLRGRDFIFFPSSLLSEQLWVLFQPQRLEISFWLWTVFSSDSSAASFSYPALYLACMAHIIQEGWLHKTTEMV